MASQAVALERSLLSDDKLFAQARDALRVSAPEHKSKRSGLPLLPMQSPGAGMDLQLVNQLRDQSL